MPLPDGKITFRIDDNEAQVMFWAFVERVRTLSDQRREAAAKGEDTNVIETEIVQLGALLEKLPTYKHSGKQDG